MIETLDIRYKTAPIPCEPVVSNSALDEAKERARKTADMLANQLQRGVVSKFKEVDDQGRPTFRIVEREGEGVSFIEANRNQELKGVPLKTIERRAGLK